MMWIWRKRQRMAQDINTTLMEWMVWTTATVRFRFSSSWSIHLERQWCWLNALELHIVRSCCSMVSGMWRWDLYVQNCVSACLFSFGPGAQVGEEYHAASSVVVQEEHLEEKWTSTDVTYPMLSCAVVCPICADFHMSRRKLLQDSCALRFFGLQVWDFSVVPTCSRSKVVLRDIHCMDIIGSGGMNWMTWMSFMNWMNCVLWCRMTQAT